MILDTTTRSARIVLGEVVITTAPTVCAFWADQVSGTGGFLPGDTNSTTNGVTPVTIVAAPGPNAQRAVNEIRAYNSDSVAHSFTLQLDDNGTIYPIETVTVDAGGTYSYVNSQPSSPDATAALLLEGGTVSLPISALPAGASLDGTELFVAVQGGSDVQTTANDIAYLILTDSFAPTNPLDAPAGSGNPGTGINLVAGAGDGVGLGGAAQLVGGPGGATATGGAAQVIGGNGGTGANGGGVFLAVGIGGAGGTDGGLYISDSSGNPALPTTDPSYSTQVWLDNGAVVLSGNPVKTIATVASGSAVLLSTTVAKDVTTLTVANAGNYWLTGVVYFTGPSSTVVQHALVSVGTVANTLDTTVGRWASVFPAGGSFAVFGADISCVICGALIVATAGETFHLVAQANFSTSSLSAYGQIAAIPIL